MHGTKAQFEEVEEDWETKRGDIKYRYFYEEFAMRCTKEGLVADE